MGRRLVILGHHYQQDEVIQYADFTGDSLKLSQIAGDQKDAEFVVFCGVHFMAESADIICNGTLPTAGLAEADGAENPGSHSTMPFSDPASVTPAGPDVSEAQRGNARREVIVILPDLSAGCSMADMAAIEQLEDAWDHLTSVTDAKIIPITYVNSAASIKAFCGRHGGACCTSSNAKKVLDWALSQGDKVLFLPDQHLGRNTAYALGNPLETMVVYDPNADHERPGDPETGKLGDSETARGGEGARGRGGEEPIGGAGLLTASRESRAASLASALSAQHSELSIQQVCEARFYLWKGHCSVHGLFTEKQVDEIRAKDPACKVLVHPECKWEVVQKADLAGSTEYIIRTLDQAPPGSHWAVGTEMHLVNRLAQKYAGVKSIRSLAGMQCLCTTMYRIDARHLLWCLDELAAGRIVNHIRVDDETRHWALIALQRMLENVPATPMAAK